MRRASHFYRQTRGLLFLGVCLLIAGAFPARPVSAASKILDLDNQLTEFTRGTFQRSSLSALQGSFDTKDQPGAVQLLPVGVLKDWEQTGFNLPKKLTDIGAVAIGTHIFVIGGLTGVGNAKGPVADVWSATIDPATGAPIKFGTEYWRAETPLPPVAAADNNPAGGAYMLAARSVPAVAAVATGPDSGYIYVLGGNIQANLTTSLSSYGVNIGTVTDGRISGWVAGPQIPDPSGLPPVGVQSASAVSLTIGGKTFIYLIGGLQRFKNGGVFQQVGVRSVLYAQVGASGQLSKPSGSAGADPVWGTLTPITLPTNPNLDPSIAGVWDAAAVADRFENGGSGLYVMGGQLQSSVGNGQALNVYNNQVFRAVIQTNGTLAWQQDNPVLTLPEGRVGLSGVQYNGAIFLTGGKPAGAAVGESEGAVLTSYVEDDLKLAQIGQSGSSFLKSQDTLTVPRSRHATVVVRATPTPDSPNPAYVYVIAGQGDTKDLDTSDDDGSDTLIMGRIGTSQDTTVSAFAPSGWYYSIPHSTIFTGAEVQEILWSTVLAHPADIQVQYRISVDNDCSTPTNLNSAQWQILDGSTGDGFFSLNGFNKVTLGTPPAANCFQYRARLSNGSAGLTTSPALLNVSIKVQVPGSPDLKVQTLRDLHDAGNSLIGLSVEILNHNSTPNEPTQPADIDSGGSFFVDLFVFGPGQTEVPPQIPFTTPPAGDVGCVNIAKSQMGIDAKLTIAQWYDVSTCASQTIDTLSLFKTPGHYVVYVAVDTGCAPTTSGCVDEGPNGENNNIKRIEFDVPNVRYRGLLPAVLRGAAAQQ